MFCECVTHTTVQQYGGCEVYGEKEEEMLLVKIDLILNKKKFAYLNLQLEQVLFIRMYVQDSLDGLNTGKGYFQFIVLKGGDVM